MDQFRRSADSHRDDDPRSSAFSTPSIIRDSSSAFSKPILPTFSSLLSPRPQFGSPSTNGSSAIESAPDPVTPPATTPTRYRECLRNHAASLGGHVIDGCGEFMPAGPADPLKCAACGCHRSFHRKEPEPDNTPKFGSSSSYLVPLLLPPAPNPNPLRFSGNTTDQSSSEERHTSSHNAKSSKRINHHNHHNCNLEKTSCPDRGQMMSSGDGGGRKKRFRTKFSAEQKEKMKAFAERVGWRVQKRDEGEMERFCGDVGVSRQVLKVWMHNNKHLVMKKQDQVMFDEGREIKVEGFQGQPQNLHLHHHDGA